MRDSGPGHHGQLHQVLQRGCRVVRAELKPGRHEAVEVARHQVALHGLHKTLGPSPGRQSGSELPGQSILGVGISVGQHGGQNLSPAVKITVTDKLLPVLQSNSLQQSQAL